MIRSLFKDVFVPEKIKSNYIVSKRIVGFDICKTEIYATQLYFSGTSITIEKSLQEPLEIDSNKSYAERVTQAIKKIVTQLDSYDEIKSSLPSSLAVFKELKVPFSDYRKINAIINYEIEAVLPFSVNDALVDYIITNIQPDKTATIFAAAVKKEFIAEHYSFFANAGIKPDILTIDMFDLYSFFKEIPGYFVQNNSAIVSLGFNITNVVFITKGQLRSIRSLPKGLMSIAKSLSQTLNISLSDALEEFLRFGLEHNTNNNYHDAVTKAIAEFWTDIQFTLTSFINKINPQENLEALYILTKGAEINKLIPFLEQQTKLKCTLLDAHEVIKASNLQIKEKKSIPHVNTLSMCTAFDTPLMEQFNLAQQEFSPSTMGLFYRQIIAATVLLLLPFIFLITTSFWQQYVLAKAVRASEQEVIRYLKDNRLAESNVLRTAIGEAEEKVKKEAEIWFSFSSQTRFSFLKYLEQLSIAIDRKSIGLTLRKLDMNYETIIIDGEVIGFNELKTFEKELRESELFINVPSLQSIKFPRLELKLKKKLEEQV